jgi:hypothetical protein
MPARNIYSDGRPADTQSMVYQRTPLGEMTNDELYQGIYRTALDTMPACQGDCQQMGGEHCPHPERCRTEDGALEMLGGMLCVVCAIVLITGGVWAYFRWAA